MVIVFVFRMLFVSCTPFSLSLSLAVSLSHSVLLSYLESSRLADVGASLPCEFESSENGGPDTNSPPPCESLTVEKHVFESSPVKPNAGVDTFAVGVTLLPFTSIAGDVLLFSLFSLINNETAVFRCFFWSLLDIGTHL